MVYYNEFNPYAADWLRELIKQGALPAGDVDERSITEVQPDDLQGYTQCHFFAGIGGWPLALRLAGWPDDRPVWSGSPPCQPFSSAGKRKGKEDERHLWPVLFSLIRECRPERFFGEQVASKDGLAWLNDVQADMEGAGYAFAGQDLCAAGFGAPHIRQRLWLVGYRVANAKDNGNQRNTRAILREDAREQTPKEQWQDKTWECVNCRAANRMANPKLHGHTSAAFRRCTCACQEEGRVLESEGRCSADWVADGNDLRHSEIQRESNQGMARGRDDQRAFNGLEPSCTTERANPINGFWRDADWLFCRDGKWRCVEPGTKPLVNGLPEHLGSLCATKAPSRQEMLKGYGNAIVPWVAKEVIEAYMDYEDYLYAVS